MYHNNFVFALQFRVWAFGELCFSVFFVTFAAKEEQDKEAHVPDIEGRKSPDEAQKVNLSENRTEFQFQTHKSLGNQFVYNFLFDIAHSQLRLEDPADKIENTEGQEEDFIFIREMSSPGSWGPESLDKFSTGFTSEDSLSVSTSLLNCLQAGNGLHAVWKLMQKWVPSVFVTETFKATIWIWFSWMC